jgi:N utilization substance protein A
VVNELRGEKVDVVQWRDDIGQFIAEALGPAKVQEVRINEEEKTADVIVSEHQLSLAIGKEGQNARLAARLSGYKVDIHPDKPIVPEEETKEADSPETAEPAAEADSEATVEGSTEEPIEGSEPGPEAESAVGQAPVAEEPVEDPVEDSAGDGTQEDAQGDPAADAEEDGVDFESEAEAAADEPSVDEGETSDDDESE